MFFWSESLKVALLTHHIPLKDVFFHLKEEKIIRFIRFLHSELTRLFKKEFTFLVSGLNPHSGEGGFIGDEEIETIIPAIKALESEMDISGPFPPDTIFLKAEEIKKAIYDYTIEHIYERGENQYFGGLALIDLGERRQGRELMRENRLPEDFLQKVRSAIR